MTSDSETSTGKAEDEVSASLRFVSFSQRVKISDHVESPIAFQSCPHGQVEVVLSRDEDVLGSCHGKNQALGHAAAGSELFDKIQKDAVEEFQLGVGACVILVCRGQQSREDNLSGAICFVLVWQATSDYSESVVELVLFQDLVECVAELHAWCVVAEPVHEVSIAPILGILGVRTTVVSAFLEVDDLEEPLFKTVKFSDLPEIRLGLRHGGRRYKLRSFVR